MIVLIATTLGGGGDGGSDGSSSRPGHARHDRGEPAHIPASYEVQSGDTLTSIAHKTGVPVSRILQLNPGVDPQILIAGEELKLK